MKKINLLYYLVAFLVLTNLTSLGILFFGRPPFPPPGGPRKFIIEKLNLDEGQEHDYDDLIIIHRNEVELLDKKIRDQGSKE